MQFIARVIGAVLSAYMVILMIRIMLTWFRTAQSSRLYRYLSIITNPYLNWFRRFSTLRFGMIDFSPIIAFVLLGFLIKICENIARYGEITVGIIIALIISGIWSIISFMMVLLIILTIVRILSSTIFRGGYLSQMAPAIDSIIEPITSWVRRTIFRNKFTPYTTQLWAATALLVILNIAGRFLFAYLTRLAAELPF